MTHLSHMAWLKYKQQNFFAFRATETGAQDRAEIDVYWMVVESKGSDWAKREGNQVCRLISGVSLDANVYDTFANAMQNITQSIRLVGKNWRGKDRGIHISGKSVETADKWVERNETFRDIQKRNPKLRPDYTPRVNPRSGYRISPTVPHHWEPEFITFCLHVKEPESR